MTACLQVTQGTGNKKEGSDSLSAGRLRGRNNIYYTDRALKVKTSKFESQKPAWKLLWAVYETLSHKTHLYYL